MDAREQRVVDATGKGLFIGGEWREAAGRFPVEDPATGEQLCAVADATPDDARAALDAACAAQADWAATPPRERSTVLRRTFELMVQRADDLALLMTLEMGKPLAESRAEITYAAEFLRWFSEEAVRIDGRYAREPAGGYRILVQRQPVGPCLLITPWNFPAAMGTRKIGPALAAGCTMIMKPAALTPLSMLAIAGLLAEAGLPGGVFNVLPTKSASEVTGPLFGDPRLRKVSFTGSTEVGRTLMEQAAQGILRVSMELGGNAPFVVFDDADLDAAVEQAVVAKMRNIGQSCVAANRFIVAEPVADRFAHALADRFAGLRLGRGTDEHADVGPLIEEKARRKVVELVDDAVSRGAKVLAGGEVPDGAGWFYPATVLTEVPRDAEMFRTEIFGPVAPVYSFRTEEEGIELANDTEYGLVAYAFTRDLERGLRAVDRLETGMVGLNRGLLSNPAAPFGGVKHSGVGREGGYEGIEEYLSVKYAAIDG
jgi:succinate-semialdehyde dehydrogenase/glutarate-semialdehyde dehydrogenase